VSSEGFAFEVDGVRTSGAVYKASEAKAVLVLAHGAGAPQTHPWIVSVAEAIRARGVDVVTFNFLYMEGKRRTPDRNDVLEKTWLAAIEAVRARSDVAHGRLFIGGKSMGGRIASQVAASGAAVAGVVLLGYPLHPPGNPGRLRSRHLPEVPVPMLFVQGSRDPFGSPAELEPIVATLGKGTRLYVVEGGDHSLSPLKSSGQTLEGVIGRVADEVVQFIG